jgi:hypothetical protein
MASKKKQGTFDKIGKSVTDAAKTAVTAAEDYVVEPVSNLLGLGGKKTKKKAAPKKAAKRPAAKKKKAKPAPKSASRTAKRPAPAKRPAVAKRPAKAKKRPAPAKRPAKAKRK